MIAKSRKAACIKALRDLFILHDSKMTAFLSLISSYFLTNIQYKRIIIHVSATFSFFVCNQYCDKEKWFMDKNEAQKILRIFEQNNIPNDSLAQLFCYIHALIAKCIFNEKYGFYNSLGEAWSSHSATFLKAYVPHTPALTENLVNELAETITDTQGRSFVKNVTPSLFIGNVDHVFDYLYEIQLGHSLRNNIYTLLKLFVVVGLRRHYHTKPYPESINALSPNLLPDFLFDHYTQWSHYIQYSKITDLSSDQLYQLWIRIHGVLYITSEIKIPSSLHKPFKALRESGCSKDDILDIVIASKLNKYFTGNDKYPIQKLKKIIHNAFDDLPVPDSPIDRLVLDDELLTRCLTKWRKTEVTDFLNALYFSSSLDNIATENLIFYALINILFNKQKTALIIDPNPEFVKMAIEDPRLSQAELTFCFFSPSLTRVYKQRFPDNRFAYWDLQSSQIYLQKKFNTSCIPPMETDDLITQPFDSIFFIVRPSSQSNLSDALLAMPAQMKTDSKMWVLTPNSILDNDAYGIRQLLYTNYRIHWLMPLPTNTSSSWFKKNTIVLLSPKNGKYQSELLIYRTQQYLLDDLTYLCIDPWPVRIPADAFFNVGRTIIRLWDQFRPKPSRGKKRATRHVDFSNEIRLWYSWSKGRGRFAFHAIPSKSQRQKNNLDRGKRLTPPNLLFSAHSIEDAESVILSKIFSQALYSTIKKEIHRAYQNKPITLKTFWFLNYDELLKKVNYNHETITQMFNNSPTLSSLRSDKHYDLDVYQKAFRRDFHDTPSNSELLKFWQQLNILLNEGAKQRMFFPNPVSEYLASMRDRDLGYRAARDALTKKSYSIEEETKMLDYMKAQLPKNGIYVGCAISFFTGLSNNEICALTWNDFHQVEHMDLWQLWVYRAVQKDGQITLFPPDKKNSYRRVPCVHTLKDLLTERKEYVLFQLSRLGRPRHDIEQMPIVPMDEDSLDTPCSPRILKAAKDETERTAGIVPLTGKVIYDDDSEKETDFNDYRADRFRANLRYRITQTAQMSIAELNYILGITAPTSFSKHYCDYTNDFAQLILCRKMERWNALHEKSNFCPERFDLKRNVQINWQRAGTRTSVDVDINAAAGEDASLSVSIEASRGADIVLSRF